jgi:hypothetical protein
MLFVLLTQCCLIKQKGGTCSTHGGMLYVKSWFGVPME